MIDGYLTLVTSLPPYLLLAITVLCASGCRTSTVIDDYRAAKDSYVDGDVAVVLGRRHEMDRDTENDFISCVGKKITGAAPELSVIPEREFVDALYPWFEASTAPMDISGLDKLLDNQTVAKQLADLNLRYFIWIKRIYRNNRQHGLSVLCGRAWRWRLLRL